MERIATEHGLVLFKDGENTASYFRLPDGRFFCESHRGGSLYKVAYCKSPMTAGDFCRSKLHEMNPPRERIAVVV